MKNRNSEQSRFFLGLIGVAILVLILLAVMIRYAFTAGAELYMGMYIILGISVLLVMLTIMTIAFARLNLSNPQQALGLPEGSIRALIALILLFVFIVLSIYVFRVVGFQQSDSNGNFSTISPDGIKLAQQLLTTLATLAVAVSGFYFGASTVAAASSVTAPSSPIIRDLDPKEGKAGEELRLKISGKNFKSPKTVRLIQGSKFIEGTGILSGDTEIQCNMNIPADAVPDTMWDLSIVNEDGAEDTLTQAFKVVSSTV